MRRRGKRCTKRKEGSGSEEMRKDGEVCKDERLGKEDGRRLVKERWYLKRPEETRIGNGRNLKRGRPGKRREGRKGGKE